MEEKYSWLAGSFFFSLLLYKYTIKALIFRSKIDFKNQNKTLLIFFMKKDCCMNIQKYCNLLSRLFPLLQKLYYLHFFCNLTTVYMLCLISPLNQVLFNKLFLQSKPFCFNALLVALLATHCTTEALEFVENTI